jgi:hypothetical protein
LHSKLTGPVFFPDDDGFHEEIAGFQTALRHRPAMVAGAVDASDVAAAVEFAAPTTCRSACRPLGTGCLSGCLAAC